MPDPTPTFVSSHGTTFTWKSNAYKCIDHNAEESAPSRERVDMTTLDVAHGSEAVMVNAPIKPKRDPKKFSISYRSMSNTVAIVGGEEGTLTTSGGSGTYRCTKAGLARRTNTYVEGTADFEEIITDEVVTS